jgi:NAD(P)H-dependent flavin oxidoreductase YrpB (nitropropane dioxygenase family)
MTSTFGKRFGVTPAIQVGADGLILLTAGAGGHTGWANPFSFVRAVRSMFDGPIVLAGGISDGRALKAAQVLGCDLAYMGTRFIATMESMASDGYRRDTLQIQTAKDLRQALFILDLANMCVRLFIGRIQSETTRKKLALSPPGSISS